MAQFEIPDVEDKDIEMLAPVLQKRVDTGVMMAYRDNNKQRQATPEDVYHANMNFGLPHHQALALATGYKLGWKRILKSAAEAEEKG